MATSTLGNGTLVLAGTTSGTTTVTATAVAGTTTLTLPAATDTLVGKATTDTLTNKTLTGAVMNGTLGATTPSTVAATSISASTTLGVTGVSTLTGGAVIEGMTVGKGAGAVATNTAVGASALAGSNSGTGVNTAVGNSALITNSTGYYNTAIGAKHPANYFSALESNTTGNSNIAVGTAALGSNTTGSSNTAVGFAALPLNTTASNNTAVGYQAGYTNVTGANFAYFGYQAGYSSTGNAGTFLGFQAGLAVTTGASNTFVGAKAGELVTTGAANTILGRYNGNQGGLDIRTASNYIVLSDGDGNPRGFFDGSGRYLLNTTTVGGGLGGSAVLTVAGLSGQDTMVVRTTSGAAGNLPLGVYNDGASGDNALLYFYTNATPSFKGGIDFNRSAGLVRYNVTSDGTLKNIIGDSDGTKSLEILKSTRIREYAWKDDLTQKPQIGVIAQELYETYKGAVGVGGNITKVDSEGNETTEYKPWTVDKTAYSFHLVAGWQAHERIIQEQQALIESLKARLDAANL